MITPVRRALTGLAWLTLRGASLAAQPAPYHVEELAPGVFAMTRETPSPGIADANVMFIINDQDVVVVDANIFPSSSRQVIAEIRKRTRKPVRYLIHTHWHDDHVVSNGIYRREFPGIEFISHPVARDTIVNGVIPDLQTNVTTAYPKLLADTRATFASGRSSSGAPTTAADSATLRARISLYDFFLKDMRGVQVIVPSITVTDSLVLHRGQRQIVVKWPGRGNTPGDLIVWLPQERILATGDLVVAPVPFAFGSFIEDWGPTLRRVRAHDAIAVMPGHGTVMRDWSYVDTLITMYEELAPRITAAVRAHATADSARQAVDFSTWRARFAASNPRYGPGFDRLFVDPIVRATHARLKTGAR